MSAERWLADLPDELEPQRTVLARLLQAVRSDEQWRWLELGCSVAQGRGDRWSDLDVGLGVADDRWTQADDDVPQLVTGLGEIVDVLYHRLPAFGDRPHLRAFVEYANGVQLDLVATPAHLPKGKQPENLILYDPDDLRDTPWEASVLQPDAATIREWTFLGWSALSDLAKYLKRGSVWEAHQRLEEARDQVWRLWGATQGLRYPLYGLTTVLDHPESGVPPGIEATVASLEPAELQRAALATASLLDEMSRLAAKTWGATLPARLAHAVLKRVRAAVDP